jgi:hypothetical protein
MQMDGLATSSLVIFEVLAAIGAPSPSGVDWASLARPLLLPSLAPGPGCPGSPGRSVVSGIGLASGPGPVYAVLGPSGVLDTDIHGSLRVGKVLWASDSAYGGPVLIRGARIDGVGQVLFGIGATAADSSLRLAENSAFGDQPPGWREWPSETAVGRPGCYAFQIDGTTFSYPIVFEAR